MESVLVRNIYIALIGGLNHIVWVVGKDDVMDFSDAVTDGQRRRSVALYWTSYIE